MACKKVKIQLNCVHLGNLCNSHAFDQFFEYQPGQIEKILPLIMPFR